MQMEYRDCVINLLDTPGHQDFSRRHLPRADRRRCRADGDRRSQRRRTADAAAAAGLPRAQHADPHLRQQDGPRGAGAAGADGRDRARARHGSRALHLAGGHGQALPRRDGPAREAHARVLARRGPAARRRRECSQGLANPIYAERFGAEWSTPTTTSSCCTDAAPPFDEAAVPRRPPDADVLRLGDQQLRRAAKCSTRWSTWRRRRRARTAMQRVVQPDEPKFSGVVFKIQANMDPAHRDRIAFVRVASGPLRARHAAEGRALGQGAAAEHRGELPVAAPRAARRGLCRRHHRHPEPRRAAARRHADRRRGAAVHRAAVLRARDVPQRRSGRPAAHQAAQGRPDAAGRGRRDPGLPPGGRQRCCCSARSGNCSSRSSRTGWSTNTAARRA